MEKAAIDFQLRLRTLMAERDLTMRGLSLDAGMAPDTVGKMLKPGAGLPRGANLSKLARALGTTEQFLISGEGVSTAAVSPAARDDIVTSASKMVQILATVAGSHENGAFQIFDNTMGWTELPKGLANREGVYAVVVINDSMFPEHKPGDVRFATPDTAPRIGDSVIVEFVRDPDEGPEAMIGHLEGRGEMVKIGKLNPEATIDIPRASVIRLHRLATSAELR